MSLTLVAWLAAFVILAVLAFTRSATYGLSLYMLTFFVNPAFWWWGESIGTYRWNLAAAIVFALAVFIERGQDTKKPIAVPAWPQLLVVAFLVNVNLVHYLLAPSQAVSFERYFLVMKFFALFVVLAVCIQNAKDLRVAFWSLTLCAAYIGYEVTINKRGQFFDGRLQGIGAAGVQEPNELAALLGTVLPFAAGLFFTGSTREKIAIAIIGPLILNVVLLCNSRGAFLALIAGAVVFLVMARGPARKKILRGFALGALALYLLLGDPEIVARFMTIFASAENRDDSAAYRLVIWSAAFSVLADHPFGSGGDGFNRVYSRQYLETGRSVHNGFLSEAIEWGVQGLLLKLCFLAAGFAVLWRTLKRRGLQDTESTVVAACLATSLAVLVVASLFADFLDNEWGYWIVGLMLGYARAYSTQARPLPTT
jgi:putative inorganic carbon (hco3(-)) transporter